MGDPREGNSRPRDLQGHRKVGAKEKELLKTKRNHPGGRALQTRDWCVLAWGLGLYF